MSHKTIEAWHQFVQTKDRPLKAINIIQQEMALRLQAATARPLN